jgi:multidrug efflux pump
VGLVSIGGGQKPSVRIQANPTSLASYGMTLEDLRTAIAGANVNEAKGNFDGKQQAYTIGDNDQLLTASEYLPLIVAYHGGAPVKLSDVATATDDAENVKAAAWMNLTPAVIVNVQRQPGANIIAVVDRIKALMPRLQASLPSSVKVQILTDRTTTIRASVQDVEFELMLTVALVVMVIFLFLRSLSATVIPSIAVPLSLIGTFGVMYMLGYSLDNLSLMALTISTGFVVDDAIVMIENISRFIEEGDKPLDAALKGAEQIGFTILSLTVSLIAVLIPLLFMGDIVGRLFREFAVTLAVTILMSAVVSLTLTPMMSAKLLKHTPEDQQTWFYRKSEKVFEDTIAFYGRTLEWVLEHEWETLMVAIATLVLTIVLYIIVPKGFFPVQDTGVIQGVSEAPQNVSFAAMVQGQQALARIILQDPAVQSLSSFVGIDGTNITVNSGRILINLKPLDARKVDITTVINRLAPKLAAVNGITLYLQPVQDLTVEDRVSRTQYQYSLEDPSGDELNLWTKKLVDKLKTLPALRNVATDQQNEGWEEHVVIDRLTASRLGITPNLIDQTLYDAFGQRQVSTIFTQLNQYHVVLEVAPEFQRNPHALDDIYIRSNTGGEVPLSAFTKFVPGAAPLAVNHEGQFPAVTISFDLAPGYSLGDRSNRDAREHRRFVPGHRRRLPRVVEERAAADSRGPGHRVYRSRSSLRELHPPGDDSFDAAVGRRRRDSGPDDLRSGSERDRPHRHHPADRYRQEKRDHDDRLRARSPAPGRQATARGDLPGLPAALSADHDDHDGGAARRFAAGVGHRRRLRAAAPARYRDRRRLAREPGAHALHDAGYLSDLRPHGDAIRQMAER